MKNDLSERISVIVLSDQDLISKVRMLKDLKDADELQADVLAQLEGMRNVLKEKEDHILELMDFVSGHCSAEHRIY